MGLRGGRTDPTGTGDGALIFARHGPDLTHQTLMTAEASPDGWREPSLVFAPHSHSDRSPAVTPDGSGLVFASDRPLSGGEDTERYALWLAHRSEGGRWEAPAPLALEGGWAYDARQPAVTADNTLYFSSNAPEGHGEGDIYVAEQVAPGLWGVPRNLGEVINGPGDEHGAFVAPDGSYMILTSAGTRPGNQGGDDLYLSLRTGDGWSEPRALDLPVNTFANEYGAWVSPADGHLYFTSDRYGYAGIFRVSREVAGLPGDQ